nr:unnamed protein product [Callosobruchus analis]
MEQTVSMSKEYLMHNRFYTAHFFVYFLPREGQKNYSQPP